jgi:LPXTG-motif cell wall-anchored protein
MSNTINTSSSPTSDAANHSEASSNNNNGLSTGATAGIAIGAIIGSIVLAVLGFMLWRKRKVDKRPPVVHGDNSFMHHDEFITSQKAYKGIHGHYDVPAELEPQATHELPQQNEPQELVGSHVPR